MILHTRTNVRRGITLLEVLTAIFIMGIGLLALLTLFPLGALSMARAVRDDRAATIAPNAASLASAMDLRNDLAVAGTTVAPGPLATAPAGFALAPDGPGYAVMVDPLYAKLGGTTIGASGTSPGLRRVSPSYASTSQQVARWFTFQDEIVFARTGEPAGGPTYVNRPGTYSWAYVVRRPRPSRPDLCELSVIVYAGRATDSISGETALTAVTAGSNTVSVTYTGDKPNIRKGGWIMDTSFQPIVNATTGTVSGTCYQVAAVTDTGAGSMTLELETPLKANVTTVVILENVITVLDRGTTWRP